MSQNQAVGNNETKHTQEPWQVRGADYAVTAFCKETEQHEPIALPLNFGGYAETPANARRIVACVNACEGIGTETLETERSYVRGRRGLLDQRDELAAALRTVQAEIQPSGNEPDIKGALITIRNALAKGSGGGHV